MPVSLSTVSAITKELYEGDVREQMNNDVVGLRRIERSSAGITSNVGGKYVTFPVHYARNAGIGSRGENADLPKAGNQGTAAAQIGLKYHYGTIQLTGQVMKLVDTNTQAFVSALDLETSGLKNDLAFNMNRQVYGSTVGAFATVSSGTTTGANIDSGMDYIGINQIVDLWKDTDLAAGSPLYSSVTITGVTDNGDGTGSVTWTITGGTPANINRITLAGNANQEWHGLSDIVSASGSLYNINPANVPQWKSFVDSPGSTTPLSEGRIIQSVDKVRKAGGKTSLLLTSLGVRRSYFGLLVQQRQFVNTSKDNKTFEGGFSGLAFTTDAGEIPLIADAFAPYNTLWGLSEKNLKIYREADWSFMDEDGSMWVRVPGSTAGTWKDAYSATMYQYSELGTDRRNVHFKIGNITEA